MNSWLDNCWTSLDSWVISSLGFQLELFVSLRCSEGLEWVVSLEISAGFIGWKFGWLEIGKNGRFTRFKSPRGRIVVYAMPTPVWIFHKQVQRQVAVKVVVAVDKVNCATVTTANSSKETAVVVVVVVAVVVVVETGSDWKVVDSKCV